jgi:type I restriction enzyme M protein
MDKLEQEFLNDLDTKLWRSADKLRSNMDAANYKHVVLGLIFLKYVSDAFEERYEELSKLFKDKSEDNLYYLSPENYSSKEEYEDAFKEELEINDYYKEANIFWVPANSRWQTIREKAVLPSGSIIWQDSKGQDIKLKSVSWLVDNALEEIEKENPKLKGILNRISRFEVENDKLIGLINAFSDTNFTKPEFQGKKLNLHSGTVANPNE